MLLPSVNANALLGQSLAYNFFERLVLRQMAVNGADGLALVLQLELELGIGNWAAAVAHRQGRSPYAL